MNECAFEPDATEILCVDCGKSTGQMGTCQDVGFCDECRSIYIAGKGEAEFSEMLISMIEGTPYRAKYIPRRVLHLSRAGHPACGTKGGPHPLTTNKNEVNCKRCLTQSAKESN